MTELREKVEAAIGRPVDCLLAEMKDVADWIERTKPQGLLYDSALPSLREAGKALDAILNLIGGDGWEPIETAPKDGTPILAGYRGHVAMLVVSWKDDWTARGWITGETDNAGDLVTFDVDVWTALPPPPVSS